MKRLILLSIAAILPAFAFAQTYTVKIYNGDNALLEDKSTELQFPKTVSKEKFAEFLKSSPDFISFDLPMAKTVKFIKSTSDANKNRREEKREFLLTPIEGNDKLVNIQLNFTEHTCTAGDKETVCEDTYAIEAAQCVSLGVPTLIHRVESVHMVIDSTPFWGDIPLIGKLWQTETKSKHSKLMLVVVTENKEKK